MDLLRSGGTAALVGAVRAPSTLGTWLRSLTHGHALQLQAVSRGLLAGLNGRVGGLLKEAPKDVDEAGLVLVDVDDTIRQVHGYRKQAAAWGYNKVKGINAIIVTACTAAGAPVVVGAGLRRGSIRSGQGAAWYLIRSMPAIGGPAPDGARTLVRADSAFATHELISAVIGMGGLFSVAVPQWPTVKKAITSIAEDAWAPIRYPRAVFDQAAGTWVSDAQVAEIRFTAFTSHPEAEQIPCRLVVRRVKDQRQQAATSTTSGQAGAQGELFPVWRYHAFITNTDLPAVVADRVHRRHAIIEQVIAEPRERPAGPPALRSVQRQRRLAAAGGDRPQHLPGGRHCREHAAGPYAHPPDPHHLSTSTPGPPRQAHNRPSAGTLALGPGMVVCGRPPPRRWATAETSLVVVFDLRRSLY